MSNTKETNYGANMVRETEHVRKRVMRTNAEGKVYAHSMIQKEYLVFIAIGSGPDNTTVYGHQTRMFYSKAEAVKYAKNTQPEALKE